MSVNAPKNLRQEMVKLILGTFALWTMTCASLAAEAQLVACDLVDDRLVTALLQSPIKQSGLNRQVRPGPDGAMESACLFFAQQGRFYVYLYEYADAADAARGFSKHLAASATVRTEHPSIPYQITKERGLGDEAYWWSLGIEAHGYVVRKGRHFIFLRAALEVATTETPVEKSKEAKARFDVSIKSIVSKL